MGPLGPSALCGWDEPGVDCQRLGSLGDERACVHDRSKGGKWTLGSYLLKVVRPMSFRTVGGQCPGKGLGLSPKYTG